MSGRFVGFRFEKRYTLLWCFRIGNLDLGKKIVLNGADDPDQDFQKVMRTSVLRRNKMVDKFVAFLEQNGWIISKNENRGDISSNEILKKYSDLPAEFVELIESYSCISSADDTTWFLCANDYDPKSDVAFKWNEFENLSLEAAEGDAVWQKEIEEWWQDKLPIVMSVGSGYSYYAIDTGNGGKIINGYEPEFEEADVVAESFADLMEQVLNGQIGV